MKNWSLYIDEDINKDFEIITEPDEKGYSDIVITVHRVSKDPDEDYDKAKMVSASPEMFKACIMMYEALTGDPRKTPLRDIVHVLKEALIKANYTK